ncbi:MAG TPA: ATP-dependent DNA helicase [Polyangiaceae bacterium]|nr:ATP-dependent DNA helicase [Polyangiaceae bacterium]
MSRVRELLGPDGPLARALDGYELRSGQLAMAEAIERGLEEQRVVLCEAGTGTGKTLAYLLPALLSGRKVIISTATRALQEQIYFKDIPLVARAFGLQPQVALMKGVSNYLCRRRFSEFMNSAESLRPGHAASVTAAQSWLAETETGDLGELSALREDDPVRLEIASSSDTRVGAACPHFEECFVTRMKREAEAAQLVVVNHHLFFADLALRGPHPARVLPDYDAVVFDEAHQIEDVATEFFSVRISSARVDRLLSDLERGLSAAGQADPLFAGASGLSLIGATQGSAEHFFRALRALCGEEGRVALERDVWKGELERLYHALDSALEGVAALAESAAGRLAESNKGRARGAGEALLLAQRRAEQLREQLATIVDSGRGRVVWLETAKRRIVLSSTPVDLSILLRERVFEGVPAIVLTSATLATDGRETKPDAPSEKSAFSYVRGRLGLDSEMTRVDELVVSSPFDFSRQALLYTPKDLPAPGTPAFWDAASARITELIEITGGGCFVLTTSLRAMRELHRRLSESVPGLPVLIQGQAPKAALVARFRAAENAVLCATSSFWEGVDVPGRALRLVVLEKIPFAVPSDPIVNARSRALEELGENAFLKLHVPMAAIALKQGFGRLVRTQRDVGVVALLDERVHRRGYGQKLLRALPTARRSSELDQVRDFWASSEAAR